MGEKIRKLYEEKKTLEKFISSCKGKKRKEIKNKISLLLDTIAELEGRFDEN